MKINHISISREQCYNECQIKYRFRYHLEVKPEGPTPFYFTYGKLVHKIIEEHTRGKGEISLEKITASVLSGEIELQPGEKAPKIEPEYKNKLTKHLSHYQRLCDKIGFDGEIEKKFTIDMDGKNRCMTGFIDRLIRKGDEFFIIDYKTTKPSMWRKNERTITKDLQLQCYCYVIKKEFDVPAKNIQSALFFLDDNKLFSAKFSEKTLASTPERLLQAYKEIEGMPPENAYPNIGKHCARCEYASQCVFYNKL